MSNKHKNDTQHFDLHDDVVKVKEALMQTAQHLKGKAESDRE